MPNCISKEIEEGILKFCFQYPSFYPDKTAKSSSDFVENHLVKKFAPVKIERLLTDGGTEFTTWHEEAAPNHEFLEGLSETRDRAYHNRSKTSLNKWLCRKVK